MRGGREIIRERDAVEPARRVVERAGAIDDRLDDGAAFGKPDLQRELEGAARAVDQFGDQELPAMPVEAPQRLAHHVDRHDAGDDRMLFAQPRRKRGEQSLRRHVQFVAQIFRGLFRVRENSCGWPRSGRARARSGWPRSGRRRRGRPFAPRPASRRGGPRYRRRRAAAANASRRGTIRRGRAAPASATSIWRNSGSEKISFSSAKKRSSSAVARSRRSRS